MGQKNFEIDLAGLKAGSNEAFTEMVKQLTPSSLKVAAQFVGNRDDARDIVQTTLIKVMNKISTLRNGAPFAPWYYHILTNTCRDWKRNYFQRFRQSLPENQKIAAVAETGDSTLSDFLRRTIVKMPEKMKMIFILHYQEEFLVSEIAEILDLSESTVRVHLMKGRKFLRKRYEKNWKGK